MTSQDNLFLSYQIKHILFSIKLVMSLILRADSKVARFMPDRWQKVIARFHTIWGKMWRLITPNFEIGAR